MSLFESDPHKLCEQRIDHAFSRDATVKFMVQKMEEVIPVHRHGAFTCLKPDIAVLLLSN